MLQVRSSYFERARALEYKIKMFMPVWTDKNIIRVYPIQPR